MHRMLQRFAVLLTGTVFFSSVSFGACSGHSHMTSLAGYALSPDATLIAAVADDGTLFWWDVVSGKRTELMECITTQEFDHPILFSPDSKRLAVVVNGAVYIFDISSGSIVARLTSLKTKEIDNITYSADGRRLAAGNEEEAVVWDVATQSELFALVKDHNHRALAVNHDGSSLAFAGNDGIEVWKVARPVVEPRIRLAKGKSVEQLLFVDGTQQLVAVEATPLPTEPKQKFLKFKREVVLWNYVASQKLKTFEGDPGEARFPLTIMNHDSLFVADYHNHLFVWNIDSGKLTAKWDTPNGHPSGDGKLLLREGDIAGQLELWKIGESDDKVLSFTYKSPLCSESFLDSSGKAKFDALFMADGFNDDDGRFGSTGYVAQDCTRLNLTRSYYHSTESAQSHFKQVGTEAAEVIETGPPKDLWAQTFLGPRMVVRQAGSHRGGSGVLTYAVVWVQGNVFYEISSSSLPVALQFEKQMLTGH